MYHQIWILNNLGFIVSDLKHSCEHNLPKQQCNGKQPSTFNYLNQSQTAGLLFHDWLKRKYCTQLRSKKLCDIFSNLFGFFRKYEHYFDHTTSKQVGQSVCTRPSLYVRCCNAWKLIIDNIRKRNVSFIHVRYTLFTK